ncbi:isopentenyl-diphosphate Delta-isomerase [Acidimangrovimonas sediminis]|uniref:Isopentenyl-diphosphate Delta-isomerase n=1 Tax=Albidovulum sediminis TaxID=3066345 RepID=A0ABT2NTM3_9RHOB|nr:isopentenyl-diphosphate Delta-isomerase [Defluviimonas sediminis]MCT8331274.1 isopentenyl-diphosphate Delta-isomerase [Defluviimonas sediminis]
MHDRIPAWADGVLAPMDKLEVHLQGVRHKAVSVFVLDGPRVLIQRRALSKYHTPGLWANTCCTHPHWDEAPADCATRRLREELGVVGLVPTHADQVEYRADVGGGMTEHEVVDIFVAEAPAGLQVTPNPDEVMDTRWLTLESLVAEVAAEPQEFTPWLKIYLAEFRDRIFGTAA